MVQPLLKRLTTVFVLVASLAALAPARGRSVVPPADRQAAGPGVPDTSWFIEAASQDEKRAKAALDRIAAVWRDAYASMIVDMARLMRPARRPQPGGGETLPSFDDEAGPGVLSGPERELDAPSIARQHPSTLIRSRLLRFLERQTGQRFGDELTRWRRWMWQLAYEPHPDYAAFKGLLYAQIDPEMRMFFPPGVTSLIRLDEVDWGGVNVNGIPPLEYPRHIPAAEARYLKDGHVVFGIAINGEARAYPKRILAWHEMALDRVGGVELTIVYCTLCGTVMPYESRVGDRLRKFGTSGLLYRSNKLMFDHETRSLWSTLEGKPVIGPLAGTGLALRAHPVVTTTWGEWRAEHPETRVLSIDTGYKRDYSEGAAYRDYFATDRLMFEVSRSDARLKNKAEVVVLLVPGSGGARHPLAISVDFLRRNPVFQAVVAGRPLVVVTSPDGANRVYDAGPTRFARRVSRDRVADADGRLWRATEEALVAEDDPGARRPRLSAQRAFWFGWYAQFPDTELIK